MRYPRTATIRRRIGTRDAYGNEVWEERTSSETPAELQQTSTLEFQADRETLVTDLLLLLPPEADLEATDLLAIDGTTYEVVGLPNAVWHPWAGTLDHHEAHLRKVTG